MKMFMASIPGIALISFLIVTGQSNAWPRQDNGHWVTKTFTFRAQVVTVVQLPTVVPDNLIIKFRILDKAVPADYYWIRYPRYRERNDSLETLVNKASHAIHCLTVDAIAVNPPTDSTFSGGIEYRHDDGSLLIGEVSNIIAESECAAKASTGTE